MPRERDNKPLPNPHSNLNVARSVALLGSWPRGLRRWLVLAVLVLVLGLVAALALHSDYPGLVSLLALACGGLAALNSWQQRQLQWQLRDARAQQALLGQLLDVWQWQTDASHRLIRLQPPLGAPSSSWVEGAFSGELLWQRFADTGQTLARRMAAQSPLLELQVQRVHDSGSSPDRALGMVVQGLPEQQWLLRGLPRLDARGQFAGYLGTARALDMALNMDMDMASTAARSQRGLDALLRDGPLALCQLWRSAPDQPWQLSRSNLAAQQMLGLNNGPVDASTWSSALHRLSERLPPKLAAHAAEWAASSPAALAEDARLDDAGWTLWTCNLDAGVATDEAEDGAPPQPSRLLGLSQADADGTARHLAQEQASFSYTISHDLRAPIRVVDGFARILKEDYGGQLDRIGNDHLDRVQAAAARMNSMIDALLSLSRLSTQPLARVTVDLSGLATQVAEDLHRSNPERLVKLGIQPGLTAMGDTTLLHLVLENLLGNAWKYSAKVALAEVSFEQVDLEGRKVFVVRDNGAGFDMRSANRLFGVFARLHGSSEFAGHGVGLASVQRIVRRHGGEIWADAEPGHGARFYFTLNA